MADNSYDVIVVGAGPGGSAAAARCAKNGFNTLLLEKAATPRVKSCTGMIMSRLAQDAIREEFGEIPAGALADPPYLKGYVVHVPGVGQEIIEKEARLTWRNALDHWMNRKVEQAGGEVRRNTRFDAAAEDKRGYKLMVQTAEGREELKTRWLVGADGAASTVRKHLFPDLLVHYGEAIQEYHRCRLDMDKGWFHAFFPLEYPPFYFSAYRKNEFAVVETGSRKEQMESFLRLAKNTLAEDFGFDISSVHERKEGCVEPALYRELVSGQFVPAVGSVLLVGDAAGLLMPITGEGIGLALKSGIAAAEAISESTKSQKSAAYCYRKNLSAIIETIGEFHNKARTIKEQVNQKEGYLLGIAQAWRKTLDVS